ncbi:MAG: HAD family hydrolase [Blastocatellia bacterium]
MRTNIEWVVFDLGGVVVRLNLDGALRDLARQSETDTETIAGFLRQPDSDGLSMEDKLQLGHISFADYARQLNQVLRRPLEMESLAELRLRVIQGEDEDTLRIISALTETVRVACFSNTHQLHWDHMAAHYQSFGLFHKTVASHLIRAAKPDRQAFDLAAAQIGADPARSLFIDDAPANVEAARGYGWNALHFRDAAELRRQLIEKYGLAV